MEEIHAPPPPKISKVSGLGSPNSKISKDLAPPPPVISESVAASDGKSHVSLNITDIVMCSRLLKKIRSGVL